MARCAQLERDYDGAGPDRFLADAWATASTTAGGDLERAREHFEYALHAAPDHFATRVLYALDYATKVQDRELFETELQRVLDSDPGGADVAAENVVEQHRAQLALARMPQLFP
jgi:tetratricopeptide (TPR) repeat protein